MELHCKVAFRNELRRFPLNGVGFQDLQKIIQNLFGLDKEFVLQYRDNENDLIVLSSNEELHCALSCINGNILQIVVQDPNPPTMDLDQKTPPPFFHPFGHFRNYHHGGPFHHPHFPPPHGHPHHFPPNFHRHCHFGKDQHRVNRICLKREMMSKKLKEIENELLEFSGKDEGTMNPVQVQRLRLLQKKKRSMENHLLKLEDMSLPFGKKCFKKRAKNEKKFMKKMDKHEKFLFESPFLSGIQGNTELTEVLSKIQSLKPEFEEIKIQLKASKAALKEAQERGESTDQWVNEISVLKEAKRTKKQQLAPLCLQVRDMSARVVH